MDNPSEIIDCAEKQGTICHITLVCTRLRKNAMYVMGDRCLITLRADVQAVRRARRFTSGTVRRSHDGHSAHAPRRGALASRRHRSHDDVIRYHGNCRRRRSGRRRMSAGAVASAPAWVYRVAYWRQLGVAGLLHPRPCLESTARWRILINIPLKW